MRAKFLIWLAALLTLVAWSASAATTQVTLVLPVDTAKPGDTVLAGIHMRMNPHWHTYWKNPGDAGEATSIQWNLPRGIAAGEIEWPLPNKIVTGPVITYGYDDEVVLLVPLKLDANLAPGSYQLTFTPPAGCSTNKRPTSTPAMLRV